MTGLAVLEQTPRLATLAVVGYALFLVIARWPVTRVMTVERRFLLLFFLLELTAAATNTLLRLLAAGRPDVGAWLGLLTQGFAAAYLHYAVPAAFRRPWYRFTRRRRVPRA